MPSAASAYALHRPSRASARNRENSTNGPGVASTVTPPASASEHSPPRSDCTARCNATSDDDHAVSTVTAGPCNPNEEEIRLEALPAVRCPTACSPDPPRRTRESSTKVPTNTLVAQRRRVDPGPLQRLPRRLKQQPLLRIHRHRLTRRDPEKPRIKLSRVMHEPPRPHIRSPHVIGIIIEQRLQVPAPVRGEAGDGMRAREDQVPQLFRRADPARVTAGHPHHYPRIVTGHRRYRYLRLNRRFDQVIIAADRHVRSQEIG